MPSNKFLPDQGAADSVVSRVLAYINEFDKEFSGRIRGASIDAISHYEDLSKVGVSLGEISPTYLEFVLRMGADDCGLLSKNLRIKSNFYSLINYYEDCIKLEPETLNELFPVVATYMFGDQVSLNYSSDFPGIEVLETSDGEFQEVLSNSWENLLMQAAFLKIEPLRLSRGCWVSSSENSAKNSIRINVNGMQSAAFEVHKLANELQLDIAWFSDEKRISAIANDSSFFAKISKSNRSIINFFSNDKSFLEEATEYCIANLGAIAHGSLVNIDGELTDAPK